jgi:hypothetical protein
MATLTNLESKLGEVTGLAMAAKSATSTITKLARKQDKELVSTLKQMAADAAETEKRMAEAGEVGHWEVLGEMAGTAGRKEVDALVKWALPIQKRHLETARRASAKLAAAEDPNEESS